MNVLVCVKRVPAPGARIVLTDDRQAIETRHLGFAISPHEECAVEEAVQITERIDGAVTVLTLGPSEAEEQLRNALAVGVHEAVLLETDGEEWDPQATSRAIASAIASLEAETEMFGLILFGNEAADSAGYQVGIRVAQALGRPVINGIKGIELNDSVAHARRETPSGSEIFEVPLPAVIGVKEGINLPRYPTLPGRLKARKTEIARLSEENVPGQLRKLHLHHPPEQLGETQILGTGTEAAARTVELLQELGVA